MQLLVEVELEMDEEALHRRIEQNPAIISYFKDMRLVKHEFQVDGKFIDFVFEDENFYYLVEMKYERDPVEAIMDLDKKAPLYAKQQGIDPEKIKEVILIDKKSYEKRKDDVEYHRSRRGLEIIIYDPEDLFKEISEFQTPVDQEQKLLSEERLEKMFKGYTSIVKAKLSLLKETEEKYVILGRTKAIQEEYGNRAAMYMGRICEKTEGYYGYKVLLDAIQPHKIFICGKTGSGKSYTMGVIAEELAMLNIGVGVVLIDPMGIFWSMKFPCKEQKALPLSDWRLSAQGFENVKVFVPVGFYGKTPRGTRDSTFAIRPNELDPEDWCNTFGLDMYKSPQGAMLINVIKAVKSGYAAEIEGKRRSVTPRDNYTIDDMIYCAEYNARFSGKYRSDSIRALIMHLEAAKNWGIFSTTATPIQSLSVPNQVSVVDISFLPEYSRALVVGILARKILEERTKIARYFKAEELGEEGAKSEDVGEIPVTWLMVDEAHVLVPSKGKTAASEPLVEYAKRGRMPGCALVLCTQQPYATDDRILSQVDVLIAHNLSFADDISAFKARAPSFLPLELSGQSFIRRLPVGVAVIADQSMTTERAFVMQIRPRVSEHAGRIVPPEAFKPEEVVAKEEPVVEEKPPEVIPPPTGAPIAPSLFVSNKLATDYLIRVVQYRFSEYLEPVGEKRFARLSTFTLQEVNPEILGILMGHLQEASYAVDEIRDVDGTPVILFCQEDVKLALTACLTETATIVAYGFSSTREHESTELLELLRQILARVCKS